MKNVGAGCSTRWANWPTRGILRAIWHVWKKRAISTNEAHSHEIDQIASIAAKSRIVDPIAALAESAMEDDDLVLAARIFSILRLGAPRQIESLRPRMVRRLEDVIVRRCDQLHEELNRVGRATISAAENLAVCKAQSRFCHESIEPVLAHLSEMAGDDSGQLLLARCEVARARARVGQSWAILRRFKTARRWFNSALKLAQGTVLEQAICENMERCQRAIRGKPPGPPGTSAPVVRLGQPFIPTFARRKLPKRAILARYAGAFIRIASLINGFLNSTPSHTSNSGRPILFEPGSRQATSPVIDTYALLMRDLAVTTGGISQKAEFTGRDALGGDQFFVDL